MPILRRCAAFPAVIIPLALALFCGRDSNNPAAAQENGMLEIMARVVNKALAKSGAAAATVADSLVVEISADDMKTLTITRKLDFTRPSVGDTLTEIPPGKNRRVVIWAIDKKGATTHIDSVEKHGTINIEKAVVTSILATLIPAAGSIYLQFLGLGTDISLVQATFTALDNEELIAESSVKREAKMFMSLDNIPHEAAGILRVAVVSAKGDTTLLAADTMTFNARVDNVINLEFKSYSGIIKTDVTVYTSGVTIGTYDFKSKEADVVETGELVITEIMWNAGNDNYIELYNPADEVFSDMLTTDTDGTQRDFDSVTIAPKGYLVIGRQNLPYVDIYPSAVSGLPIVSTGNWIAVRRGRDGPVIDRVVCAGNKSATGWPPVSGKRSIELARDKYNVTDNNYGKNWSAASEFINEESPYYGTPGR
jgi:hypothetical protein